jgi:hypothetical protein
VSQKANTKSKGQSTARVTAAVVESQAMDGRSGVTAGKTRVNATWVEAAIADDR